MFDGGYHTEIKRHDRRYVALDSADYVERYNKLCVYNSNSYVLSCNQDFDIISRMLAKRPDLFDIPKLSLSYGGKTYYPKKNRFLDEII